MKSSRFGNYFQKRRPRITVDLGCQKMMEGSVFRGLDRSQKLLSDLDLGGPGDLRSDLRGHPRPKIAKIVISPSLKDDNFFILEDPHLRPFEATTSSDLRGRLRPRPQIRPPRPPEAKNRESTILLILMVELKVCGWMVSARGSGERSEPSEPAAGRPRK